MTDPKTIWLEPSCDDALCPKDRAMCGLEVSEERPEWPCLFCGRQPTEYVKKEE